MMVSQSCFPQAGTQKAGESWRGPKAQDYCVGQAALALWAGSGVM